ncbi:MAG: hypothetical protein ACI843_000030 [Psychrobacter glaciei]|jgi:hypothetical protein
MEGSIIQHIKYTFTFVLLLVSFQSIGSTVGLLVEDKNQQALEFQTVVAQLNPNFTFQLYTSTELPKAVLSNSINTWIALGAKPLAMILGRIKPLANANEIRILGLFVRTEAKVKLGALYPNIPFTLLDNSPKLEHQLALIKLLSPQIKSIAVLHSPSSDNNLLQIINLAEKFDLKVNTAVINDPLNWDMASLKAVKESDAVLGINDRAIYNATTIRSILMRLYRASRPLIGPDKGYVRAGAVASSYSGVKETLQTVTQLLSSKQIWPEIIQNQNFNVAVNTQVARSLNINIVDPSSLANKIRELVK